MFQPSNISTEIIQQISPQQAWHYLVLPFRETEGKLELYIAENQMKKGIDDELELLLGRPVRLTTMGREEVKNAIAKYYRKPSNSRFSNKKMVFREGDTTNMLTNLIQEAKQLESSDIHFEAGEEKCRIRMRMDGKLTERYIINKSDYPSLINKIKIRAQLDIAEKRLPQDGRIFIHQPDLGKLDVRVSVLPTLHGEKAVLRLLSNTMTNLELDILGFNQNDLTNYLQGIKKPNGIVLISGPTGSGKTTTLYATLQLLNQPTTNILTIEDPIEYTLEGINQVQLKENIGLDFPSAMRTFLRQDPDIIMVGEIRDKATASMAIRASLTGHLVFSTLHTNSAWGIVARLIDMGIPSYLLADTLNTAVAQRLVRLLCTHCKEEVPFTTDLYPPSYKAPVFLVNHWVAKGCENCYFTGYKGRKGIYEVISIDNELAKHIKNLNLNPEEALNERSLKSLSDNAFNLFQQGKTSIEEVYPILSNA